MDFKALGKTAPLHIIPCYANMFTDRPLRRRNFYFQQRNPLPTNPCCSQIFVCNRAIDTNIFVYNPNQTEKALHEETSYPKAKEMRSVRCQTMFRESSAQTDPWLPGAKLREGEKCFPEVLMVNCDFEPGSREIEAVERSRLRRHWENLLPSFSKEELPKRLAQLEAFEWEKIIARERELNEHQFDRMQQVTQMIHDREENANAFNGAMLENVYQRSKAELEKKRSKLFLIHQRKLRKLKGMLPQDDLKKNMHERSKLNVLESNSIQSMAELFKSTNLGTCLIDFSKRLESRKKLWHPKGTVKESSHGVRSEHNLRKLCDSLKTNKKRDGLQCRLRRPITTELIDSSDAIDDRENREQMNEDSKLLRVTLKGISDRNNWIAGMENSMSCIENYRRTFQIGECDYSETVAKQANVHAVNLVVDPLVTSIIESAEKINQLQAIKPFIDEIVTTADQIVTETMNKKPDRTSDEALELFTGDFLIDLVKIICKDFVEDILNKLEN